MDEEPGAVINRLLEDGDVQIIDPPPRTQQSVQATGYLLSRPLLAFVRIPKLSPICCRNPKHVKATGYQIFTSTACLRANSETLADLQIKIQGVGLQTGIGSARSYIRPRKLSAVLILVPFNLKL